VAVGGSITVAISATAYTLCPGNSATLTASGANTFTWNNGSTTSSIVINPSQTSVYSVTGANGGCTGASSISITVNAADSLIVSPDATVCIGRSATLTASGAYTNYAWNNLPANANLVVTPSVTTTYTLVASGSPAGCVTSTLVTITVTNNPTSALNTASSLCDKCTGSLTVNTMGGTAPYSYSLSNNACTVPCASLCAGLYQLYTTDAAGCKGVNYFSIECSGISTMIAEVGDENLLIFPNPASDELNVRLNGDFTYHLMSVEGQILIAGKDSSSTKIALTAITPGIYFLKIQGVNNTTVKKVVIE
jgi:hypothetical protein